MAQKIEVEFELKYKEAVKNLDEFQKEYSKLEKEVVSANKKTADSLSKVEKSAESGAKGVKKVGLSIKNIASATGVIFLLQKAFEFVSSAIQENQAVMDGLNLVFETAQGLFNQVANVFVDVYNNVSAATENFDALGKVLSGLVTIALTPLKLSFYGITLAIQEAQLMWEKSPFGDGDTSTIAELNASILETKGNILEVAEAAADAGGDIVTNFAEAVTEVGEIGSQVVEGLSKVSVEAALETAKTNQSLKKSAEIAAAQSRILLEQYDRQAELQRQIRDDETKSISERQEANEKLNTILDKQEKEMTKNANLVKAAAQAQFDLTGKTEDYVRVLEAEAEVQGIASQVTGFRSEQQTNKNALDKEAIELTNAKLESESLLSIEQKRFNAEQIEDELLKLQALKEVDALEAEQETIRLQAIVDNANAGTQAKIDAQIALNEFTEQSRQTNLTRDKEIADIKNKNDADELEKDKILQNQKIAIVGQTFGTMAEILGKNSKAGKAFGIAQALTNTYLGVTEVLGNDTTLPEPFGTIQKVSSIAGVLATGFAAVKSIKSVKPNGGGGGGTPSLSSGGSSAPTPPSFNVVGTSGTNQLASAIGGQTQQPVKAFVVSNDVTTAQELERNIISNASIG